MCTRSARRTCTRDGRADVGGPGRGGPGRGTARLGAGAGPPGAAPAPGDPPGAAGPGPRHHLVGRARTTPSCPNCPSRTGSWSRGRCTGGGSSRWTDGTAGRSSGAGAGAGAGGRGLVAPSRAPELAPFSEALEAPLPVTSVSPSQRSRRSGPNSHRAREGEPGRVPDVRAGRRQPQFQRARFDDPSARAVGEGRQIGVEAEGDPAGLAGLQLQPLVADQADVGPGHRGHRVVQVQLDHLGARAVARVADGDREVVGAVRADLRRAGPRCPPTRTPCRRAPVAEGVQRGRVQVADLARQAQRRLEVGPRLAAGQRAGRSPGGGPRGSPGPTALPPPPGRPPPRGRTPGRPRPAGRASGPARRGGRSAAPAPRGRRSRPARPATPPGRPAVAGPSRRSPRPRCPGRTVPPGRRAPPRRRPPRPCGPPPPRSPRCPGP